jgi:hypothetical protein
MGLVKGRSKEDEDPATLRGLTRINLAVKTRRTSRVPIIREIPDRLNIGLAFFRLHLGARGAGNPGEAEKADPIRTQVAPQREWTSHTSGKSSIGQGFLCRTMDRKYLLLRVCAGCFRSMRRKAGAERLLFHQAVLLLIVYRLIVYKTPPWAFGFRPTNKARPCGTSARTPARKEMVAGKTGGSGRHAPDVPGGN